MSCGKATRPTVLDRYRCVHCAVDFRLRMRTLGVKDFNPNQPRDPHTGEWIDGPNLPNGGWFWSDGETRFGVETPASVAADGIQPGTQAAAAADAYTTGSYRELNRRTIAGEALSPEQQAISDALNAAMKPLPDHPTVFRGVRGIGPTSGIGPGMGGSDEETFRLLGEWAQRTFKVGDTVDLPGLQSTSFDTQPALDAGLSRSSPGIIFEIRTSRGVSLEGVSNFSDEAELLLPGGRFQVRGVLPNAAIQDTDGETRRRVIVQLIQL